MGLVANTYNPSMEEEEDSRSGVEFYIIRPWWDWGLNSEALS
jgi:hypothetical protein